MAITAIAVTHAARIGVFFAARPAGLNGGTIGIAAVSCFTVAIVTDFSAPDEPVAAVTNTGLISIGTGPAVLNFAGRATPIVRCRIAIIAGFFTDHLPVATIPQANASSVGVCFGTGPAIFYGGAVCRTAVSIDFATIITGLYAAKIPIATQSGTSNDVAIPALFDSALGTTSIIGIRIAVVAGLSAQDSAITTFRCAH